MKKKYIKLLTTVVLTLIISATGTVYGAERNKDTANDGSRSTINFDLPDRHLS